MGSHLRQPLELPLKMIKLDVTDWLVTCDPRHLTLCAAAALTERQRHAASQLKEACAAGACCVLAGIPAATLDVFERAATAAQTNGSLDEDADERVAAARDAFRALATAALKLCAAAFGLHESQLAVGARADRFVAGAGAVPEHALALRYADGAVRLSVGRPRTAAGDVAGVAPVAGADLGPAALSYFAGFVS